MKRLLIIFSLLLLFVSVEGQIIRANSFARATAAAGSTYQTVLADGDTWGWFISTEEVTKDGSNYVTAWGDYSASGNDLTGYGGTPLWSANGIYFDGSDDFIRMATVSPALDQPFMIYVVIKNYTMETNDHIFRLGGGNFTQGTSELGYRLNLGAELEGGGAYADETWQLVRVVANGANSVIQVNGGSASTGDASTGTMSSFQICGAAAPSNIEVKEIIVRKVQDSAGDQTLIVNYLNGKYSIY